LGYYNPLTDPAEVKIDAEKAEKWLGNGAQPTETVKALLKKAGITKPGKTAGAEAATEVVE
jgi:small subunit ribosomal protein S16